MKKALLSFASFILACSLCIPAPVVPAFAAGEPAGYAQAKVDLDRLRKDPRRAKYRHSWLKLADEFQEIYEGAPSWNNRPAALFRSAEALEEMARRSFTRKDAQEAASRFEFLAKKHPSSVLADDALYRAAVIRNELMRDPGEARTLLTTLRKKYAKSDHAAPAASYLAKMDSKPDASAVASLAPIAAPAPARDAKRKSPRDNDNADELLATLSRSSAQKSSPPKGVAVASLASGTIPAGVTQPDPLASVSRVSPQKRGDVIRITISLDQPSSWKIQHETGSKGKAPRLILDLEGTAPAKAVKSGARYKEMGIFSRYSVDYSATDKRTRMEFDFSSLRRYTVKTEKSPFRIIVEATASSKALADGISIAEPSPGTSKTASSTAAHTPKVTPPRDVAEQLGLCVKTIVIDPGHGGKDPGTSHNNITERELTLDVSKRLGSVLRAAGYNVVFTRERDAWVSLSERSNFAVKKKGDLFISIHVNASAKPNVSGFETYYLDLAGNKESVRLAALENSGTNHRLGEMEAILTDLLLSARIQESRKLATEIQKNTVSHIKKRGHQVNNNGTKGAPFHVLIGSSMPGVLVEIGYCTNSAEAKRLKQSKYRDALAEGIANGIHNYARQLELAGK